MAGLKSSYEEFIALSRYARWIEAENRRETWEETVERLITFWEGRFPKYSNLLREEVQPAIYSTEVMPSMRSLMTAGPALERDEVAGFNCSYVAVDDVKVFDEIMYVLMCGTGLGFSVERQYITKLPEVAEEFSKTETTIIVGDSKIGWSKAFRELISLLYQGRIPAWDVSKVRPSGAKLKTFGGRASGPKPLIDLFNFSVGIFKRAKGRKLNSIEVHDLVCKIADIVVVGGVRRCLPINSLVQLGTGLRKIQDINVGDIVESGGKTAKVIESVSSGVQDIYRISHQYGFLDCTANHEVAIFNEDAEIVFKLAREITEADTLVWDSQGFIGSQQIMPPFTEKLHFNAKPFIIPEIDIEVSWLIGLIHGDGHISDKGIEITAADHEIVLLEKANEIFTKFMLSGVISQGHGKCKRLRINSSGLARWFKEHIKQAKLDITIPAFIKDNTKDIRYAYLAGLFDSDGRTRKDNVIEQVTSIYPKFSESVRDMLSGLGIAGVKHFNSAEKRRQAGVNAQDFYNINIRGITNRKEWLRTVGGYSKGDKLKNATVSVGNGSDFKYKTEMLGSPKGWKAGKNITLTSAIENDFIEAPVFLPTQVQSVEHKEKQETFDIEVEDLHYFTTGGLLVHNSALISLSNLSDPRMRDAKSGQWWATEPQRALANNSVCYTEKPDIGIFMEEWKSLYDSKSGERGVFNREAANALLPERRAELGYTEWGCNPCSEIVLRSKQFCNLTEVVVRASDTLDDLKRKVRLATILGTMQASLTNFRYLSSAWRDNTEEEALLGVSLTGIMDHVVTSGQEPLFEQNADGIVSIPLSEVLEELREVSLSTNENWATKLGVNAATAITAVKPSGTVSQLVDSASGIHPRYSDYYIRTVRADNKDPLAQMMLAQGFPCEEDVMKPGTGLIFSFPIRSPLGSVKRDDMSAIEQCEIWKTYQLHWTEHKPSITVYVKEEEWLQVGSWVYDNFDIVSGISFLPHSDHSYQQAPYQEINKEEYEEWLLRMPKANWSELGTYEKEDTTKSMKELACVAGACEIL